MYDCSYIMCANMKYEVVNGYKCTLLRGAILLLQVNPEFEEFQTRMISACKTKYVTHGFDLNSNEGTSQS